MKKASFQVSQGLELLMPKAGKAYPIPCDEWALLKGKLVELTSEPWLFHTIGSVLLGAALSTLATIIIGTFRAPELNLQLIIAWSIFAVALICGIVSLIFAHKERRIHHERVSNVVSQMDLIEKRYENIRADISVGQLWQNLFAPKKENKNPEVN